MGLILHWQLRLYINAAFVHLHERYETVDAENWAWSIWFAKNAHAIDLITSFNYDLILENNLYRSSERQLRYTIGDYPASRDGRKRKAPPIHIFKPHGSINFRIFQLEISIGPRSLYTTAHIFSLVDAPIEPVKDLHAYGVLPDIVLPADRREWGLLSSGVAARCSSDM